MSLKQLAIGVTIIIYACVGLGFFFTMHGFYISLLIVGILWVLEQFGIGTVSRPGRRTEVQA